MRAIHFWFFPNWDLSYNPYYNSKGQESFENSSSTQEASFINQQMKSWFKKYRELDVYYTDLSLPNRELTTW